MSSLKSLTIKGVKWTAVSATFLAITGPLYLTIKARYLIPEEFGYMSILMIVIGLIDQLEGSGINKGVIQKDTIDTEDASSLFILNFFISISMAIILVLSAQFIASFFQLDRLNYYLKILSIGVAFHAPTKFLRAFLERLFLFKEIALIEMVSKLIEISVATFFFVKGLGVLGFVYGILVSRLITTILIIFIGIRYKVTKLKLYFSINKLGYFIRFGAYASGRSFINYTAKRIDEIVIGYFLSPEILGVYSFGKNLLEQLRGVLNRAFSRVLLPLFSKINKEPNKLAAIYYRLTYYLSLVAFPIFIGVSVTAHLFVPVIFGTQWNESIIVIQIFSLAFILKMLTDGLAANLLYAVNKPDIVLYFDLITDSLYFLTLVIFAQLGMNAIIVVFSIYIVLKAITMQYVTHKYINSTLKNYFSKLVKIFAFTLLMVAIILIFQNVFLNSMIGLFQLIGSVLIGAIVYVTLIIKFDKRVVIEIINLVRS